MAHRRILASAFVVTVGLVGASAAPGCSSDIAFDNSANCPASIPANNAACDLDGLACVYTDDCTNETLNARCDGGSWAVDTPSTCNPPPPCPANQPTDGGACSDIGVECRYGLDDCGLERLSVCQEDGTWMEYLNTCNPPPAECPDELPVAGVACEEQIDTIDGYPSGCVYELELSCGTVTAQAGCAFVADEFAGFYAWEVDAPNSCASEPKACYSYDHETVCGVDQGCQWLHPGCAQEGETPAVEGCYPTGDCSDSGCGDYGSCTSLIDDPCIHDFCDSCSQEVNVCVANEP